jgi:hypothetical protein
MSVLSRCTSKKATSLMSHNMHMEATHLLPCLLLQRGHHCHSTCLEECTDKEPLQSTARPKYAMIAILTRSHLEGQRQALHM